MFNFIYNLLYSCISFAVSIFFILLGIIGLLLPWSDYLRADLVDFILGNSMAISLFGFGFLIIGLASLIYMIQGLKSRYYYVKVGKKSVIVHEEIIAEYLKTYWRQVFPGQEVSSRIVLKKKNLKLYADLPYVPKEEHQTLMNKIQEELQDIFVNILGYHNPFILALSFKSKPD